jgi:hypothetical protein
MLDLGSALLVLFVVVLLLAFVALWRFANSGGNISWNVSTSHPEPNHVEITRLEQERDEARREAERFRDTERPPP